nr:DUF1116 domain-containing protein [Rhodoplanes serenus]
MFCRVSGDRAPGAAPGRWHRGETAVDKIEAANKEVLGRILRADPVLVDVKPAGEVIEGLERGTILHAGPPIEWSRMCGPMQGAVCGIAVFEGLAKTLDEAAEAAASGAFRFQPNHHFGAVGPMTGMITPSQPVLVVENRAFGNRAYSTINEGLGKVLRFGGNDAEVLARLRWIADELGPALSAALRQCGGIPLKGIVSRGLAMGDEMHQRNVACSSLFLREIAPPLARALDGSGGALARVLEFVAKNDQFFLNIAMAMAKSMTDPARGVDGSTIVTAMSRNGTEFGIQVSGTDRQWFTAPVEMPVGMYFPGYSEKDANPDMGDSAIVEVVGLGGFAMASATAVAGFVGAGSASEAAQYTRSMYEITAAQNPDWSMPNLDYAGVPTGIDIRKVLRTGITPYINTGIAHRLAGVGQVGAGIARAPLACFEQALTTLAQRLGVD